MYHSTNGQVPSADGQVSFRQVFIDGAPFWQASSGRTFPVVAGGEDPPGDGKRADTGADEAEQESADDYDKERGFRKIQAQAADLQKLKAERDALRAQTRELDALKAKDALREREKLSETERLAAEKADLEKKLADHETAMREMRTEHAIERAATSQGARKPGIVAKLIDRSALQYDGDGSPTNVEDLVKELLKAEPYLVGKGDAASTGVPGSPRSNGAISRDDQVNKNREELRGSPLYQPLG